MLCEGKITEPQYIRGFHKWKRSAVVEVDIPPEHGVPRTLVDVANERKKRAEDEARDERDDNLAFDEVWCVYDVDEHPHLNDAWQKARDNGIQLAISNPCFELWLLLHFRDAPGPRDRRTVGKMVASYVSQYRKHIGFEHFENGYQQARKRAKRLDAAAEEEGDAGRNPSTGVYRLTESIARP